MRKITGFEYRGYFDKGDAKKALELALDIRKFEIQLYWTRTAYFWALIAAVFAGFLALQAASDLKESIRQLLSYVLCCVGLVFNFGWFLANRGSKFWQENWERHVDMLEDGIGPLYKIGFRRTNTGIVHSLTGAGEYSVSKVNQFLSLFTLFVWLLLAVWAISQVSSLEWYYHATSVLTGVAVVSLWCFGLSSNGGGDVEAYIRDTPLRAADGEGQPSEAKA